MSLSVIPLTILGQITGVTGSGDTALYQVSFKSIDGTPLYGVTAVWTDEQAEIEALAAEKPYGVWINPIDGTFTVKFAGYTYVGSADLTDADVLSGVTPIEFTSAEVSDRLLPEVDAEDAGKTMVVNEEGEWELGEGGGGSTLYYHKIDVNIGTLSHYIITFMCDRETPFTEAELITYIGEKTIPLYPSIGHIATATRCTIVIGLSMYTEDDGEGNLALSIDYRQFVFTQTNDYLTGIIPSYTSAYATINEYVSITPV